MFPKNFFLGALLLSIFSINLWAAEAKSVAGISFSAPGHWKETKPQSSMRKYQFEIPGAEENSAELVVFHFGPSEGGDVQGNIDRWKGQFATVTKEETKNQTVGGIKITQVYFQGNYQASSMMMTPEGAPKKDYAMLGAIIEAPQGSVFLKLTGPEKTVGAASSDFESLLSGIRKI